MTMELLFSEGNFQDPKVLFGIHLGLYHNLTWKIKGLITPSH